VRSYGLRLHKGSLVIPVRDASGELHSLQFIAPDGSKKFLTGGRVHGCYFGIGTPEGAICICEGFATGATIHEATDYPVAVAFNAGNLVPVARALREEFPEMPLILCADHDAATEGNPGLTKANAAARSVGGLLAVPDFGTERPEDASDFNDLARLRGPEAVRNAVEAAGAPERAEQRPAAVNARAGAIAAQEWPEPLPLPEGLPAVTPFDFALLPETLRPWAEDICERVQCPPDFVGAAIIAALGSVLGRKVGIRPQEKTDWTELPNQWALTVGRPGVLKSPAMEAALSPLKRLAAQAAESHNAEMEEYQGAARLTKLRAEASEKAARAKLAKNPAADVSGDLVDDEREAPTLRRYIANDTTAAALGELLRQNPNGLLVFRDELVSLLKGLDREDNAEARGFYLTGWNGNSAYTFDRIGRGMNLHIPAVCLSLLGSTQPGRIAEYLRAAVKGGAGDDVLQALLRQRALVDVRRAGAHLAVGETGDGGGHAVG
jgi:putative DNA primase/helicase